MYSKLGYFKLFRHDNTYLEIQPVSTRARYRLSCTVDKRRRRTSSWNRWGRLKNSPRWMSLLLDQSEVCSPVFRLSLN